MADYTSAKRVDQLLELTSIDDTDLVIISPTTQAKKITWGNVKVTLSTLYAGASHSHAIADVTGLQTALDGKAASTHDHTISQVTNLQTTLDGKANTNHSHIINDTTGLQTALNGKSDVGHTHLAVDISDLASELSGKSDVGHGHAISDVTGLQTALDDKAAASALSSKQNSDSFLTAISGLSGTASQVLRRNASNTAYEFATISGGGTVDLTTDVTGVLPVDNGGTGLDLSDLSGQAGMVVAVKGDESGYEFVSAGGGSGTVTSVGVSAPSSIFEVGSSPVTASGTIVLSFATGQAAHYVLGTDSSGNVGLMGLTAAQIATAVAPGASGNVLTSDGTTWTSAAPSGGGGGGDPVEISQDGVSVETEVATLDVIGPLLEATSISAGNVELAFAYPTVTVPLAGTNTVTPSGTDFDDLLPFMTDAVDTLLVNASSSGEFIAIDAHDLASFDLNRTLHIEDDFFCWSTTAASNTPFFRQVVSGTGAAAAGTTVGVSAGHLGVISLATGTTTTGRTMIANDCYMYAGNGPLVFETMFMLEDLSDGTNRFFLRAGLMSTSSNTDATGIYFRYIDNQASGNLQAICRNGGSETATDLGLTLVADTWYRGRFEVNEDWSEVKFSAYGDGSSSVNTATITTDIPVSGTMIFPNAGAIYKNSLGTTSRLAYLDYCKVHQKLTAPRIANP